MDSQQKVVLFEETIASQTLFEGNLLHLEVLDVRLPNGNVSKREIIRHANAVCAVVFDTSGRSLLGRQYRKAVELALLEVPAGKIDPGEEPDVAILRELREEIGYVSGKIEKLFDFYCTPGFCNEMMTAYLVTDAVLAEPAPDEDEFLEIVYMSREELALAVRDGRLADAKTLVAVLEALRRS